jgi:hypothetical protein
MATMQSVIDLARLDLNDDDKVRHPDTALLVFANNFIQESINQRPDWFFAIANNLPSPTLALGAQFPVAETHMRACADYVIARANLRGTEESRMDAAAAYMQLAASSAGVA